MLRRRVQRGGGERGREQRGGGGGGGRRRRRRRRRGRERGHRARGGGAQGDDHEPSGRANRAHPRPQAAASKLVGNRRAVHVPATFISRRSAVPKNQAGSAAKFS